MTHNNAPQKQYDIQITGKVQGVYYRASTQEKAVELGLKGWVKNNADGSVQIAALGTEDQLHLLLDWCHTGPEMAKVEHVKWEETIPDSFEDFTVRR